MIYKRSELCNRWKVEAARERIIYKYKDLSDLLNYLSNLWDSNVTLNNNQVYSDGRPTGLYVKKSGDYWLGYLPAKPLTDGIIEYQIT